MEHKLILAVSGFPSLYDTNAPSYRDLNMRADSWRHVSEVIAVPESECRRKWKTLRDQHRRERQREKDRRESGVGLFNYRPWRYSSILSFLNPFIDARAAGCNGWALEPQPSHLQAHEMGCSTTTDTRSDEDDEGGYGRYGEAGGAPSLEEFPGIDMQSFSGDPSHRTSCSPDPEQRQ
ncbi:Transcription factor Adf-1 [Liparis tanakae]|uniref:Transcription factor Adf-1 n=1 Tax=Liparis tanakae TaxID=230148 RepID=A0A4Z2FU73_9TELE|nr:Transcription factor Adf-1 [Liparis tanakae]